MSDPFVPTLETMVPELRELVLREGLKPAKISVGFPLEESTNRLRHPDRHQLMISDGKRAALWIVPSLRALFRGQKTPPDLTRYPPHYVPQFMTIERAVASLFRADAPHSTRKWKKCILPSGDDRTAAVLV